MVQLVEEGPIYPPRDLSLDMAGGQAMDRGLDLDLVEDTTVSVLFLNRNPTKGQNWFELEGDTLKTNVCPSWIPMGILSS